MNTPPDYPRILRSLRATATPLQRDALEVQYIHERRVGAAIGFIFGVVLTALIGLVVLA